LKSNFHTNNSLLKHSAPRHYKSQTVVGVRENNSCLLANFRENINTKCGQKFYHCASKRCEIRPSQDGWTLVASTALTMNMLALRDALWCSV